MKRINKALRWLKTHWRGILIALMILAGATYTLSLQLNSLVEGQNQYETNTLKNLEQFPNPWNRAVNAPYMIPAYLVGKVLANPLYGARITSVVFSLLAGVCFFYIIKFWFKPKIAIVGTLLFLTSGWLLNFSHQAAPFSLMVFAPLLALVMLVWSLQTKTRYTLAFCGFAAALAIAAYVPYTPWIMIISLLVLIFKAKDKLAGLKGWHIWAAAGIYLLLLLPLFIGLLHHPGQIKELIGIPATLPTISQYLSHLLETISMIAIFAPRLPELHLTNLPILDAFSVAMFILGIYYFIRRLPKRRSLIFLGSFIILLFVLALSPDYQLGAPLLLPFIYIAIITGIVELLNRWFAYFPRNPLARNIGVALVVIAIGFSSYYHLQNYFLAWPNSPETKAVYSNSLTATSNRN